jgi:hypothetical protein
MKYVLKKIKMHGHGARQRFTRRGYTTSATPQRVRTARHEPRSALCLVQYFIPVLYIYILEVILRSSEDTMSLSFFSIVNLISLDT